MWFDLAVRQLSVCDTVSGDFLRGGIEIFEHDGSYVGGGVSGNVRHLSPGDLAEPKTLGIDPAPGSASRVPSLFDSDEVPMTWIEDPPGSGLYVQEI